MYDAIEFRGFDQEDVDTLEQYSGVPVWNGLTDMDHPTQTLANFLTFARKYRQAIERNFLCLCRPWSIQYV